MKWKKEVAGRRAAAVKRAGGILLGAAALFLLIAVVTRMGNFTNQQERLITRDAIMKAVVNCYAIEGVYPQNLEYLEQHYGVTVDHDKYVVQYDIFAPNVLPQVDVVPVGQWTIQTSAGLHEFVNSATPEETNAGAEITAGGVV